MFSSLKSNRREVSVQGMGEFRVHRVRFFNYNPCAIHCLAYDNLHHKIALSRSDATIEIWNLKENWFQEKVIPPSEGASIEALLWKGSRLFAAGLHGNLQEYDLVTGKVKHSLSSNSGPIWCMAMKEDGSQLAAGTEDGCVVLFKIIDDAIEYSRALSKQEGRILCVAWYSAEDVIVTGGCDNIRVWNVASGHAIQRLTLARLERNKETVVWAIAVTKDFTIISGDSSGKTSFWNGRQGTLIKSFQSHRADVLCLCVNEEGTSVFSSGIDPNLVQFEYIASNPSSDWKMWVRSTVRTQHTHDVRALTFAGDKLISGGVSGNLLVSNLEIKSGTKPWYRIPAIPQAPIVYTAKTSNMIMFRYSNYLEVWKLGSTKKHSDKNRDILPLEANPLKLLQLKACNDEYITCSAISPNATWIAYSDQYKLRLFKLEIENQDIGTPQISLNKLHNLPNGVQPASCMLFTANNKYLISAAITGRIQFIKLDPDYPELVNTLTPPNTGDIAAIHVIAACPHSKYVATGDLSGNVHIYSIKKVKHVATLPKLSKLPTAMAFHPVLAQLLVAYTDQMIIEFSIKENNYTEWTLEHMYHFPIVWRKSQHKIRQIMYNERDVQQIVCSTVKQITILDKKQHFPKKTFPLFAEAYKKTDHAFHICAVYKFLLHLNLLDDDFMVVVERTPLQMMELLPDSLKQKKFGT